MEKLYLDHAATTPVHPDVVELMTDLMGKTYGNPSSIHSFGREARAVLDEARTIAAKSIGADFREIIFTSGGTEADNMALIGSVMANENRGKHIISTEIEHHAVLNTCAFLEKNGFEVTYLPVDESGMVSVDSLKNALRDDTILVSVMFANNEVGSVQPIREIGKLLAEHPAYFHTDAVQAYGLLPIDVKESGIDLLSVSSHKINGPKGAGFLYVKNGVLLNPLLYGGEQERKRRAGTENLISIAGFAKAIDINMKSLKNKWEHFSRLRQIFLRVLEEEKTKFTVNGIHSSSLPNILNISFPGTNVEQILVNLDMAGIAASGGSACTAGSLEPSHVLSAMFGKDSDKLYNSVRFSFGFGLTDEEIRSAAYKVAGIIQRLKN